MICKSEHRIKSKDCDCVSLSHDGGSVAEVTGGEVDRVLSSALFNDALNYRNCIASVMDE